MTIDMARTDNAAAGRVLVTGASGFVGRHLVGSLAAAGWRVRAAARSWELPAVPAAQFNTERAGIERVRLPDLARDVDWTPLLAGIDVVVHLAGIAHATRAIPEAAYQQVNGLSVERLADAAKAAGCRRIVYISSVRAQSGPIAAAVLAEDAQALPTDAYGRSKLRGEIGVAGRLAVGATDYVILRPVLVYGRGVGGNMGALARLARSRLPLPLGALAGERSLVSLDVLAAAIDHAAADPRASRQTLLVADGGGAPTVRQMMLAMRAGLGRRPRLVPVPPRLLRLPARLAGKADMVDRLDGPLVVDIAKLRATGFEPALGSVMGLFLWMQGGVSERRRSKAR
jgi:nucleoside-diphosphate-sugar epimerase